TASVSPPVSIVSQWRQHRRPAIMAAMPAAARKKSLASPPPGRTPDQRPVVRRGVWWGLGCALLIAVGVRLASTPAAGGWRYERQSIEALQARTERRPGDPALRLVLGRKLLAAGRSREAVEECRRAAALTPQSAEAWAALGRALAAAGQD